MKNSEITIDGQAAFGTGESLRRGPGFLSALQRREHRADWQGYTDRTKKRLARGGWHTNRRFLEVN